jgi:hypothetical protein
MISRARVRSRARKEARCWRSLTSRWLIGIAFVREGDGTAIRYADGAIKDSFGILQRVTFHQQIIARLWRFL